MSATTWILCSKIVLISTGAISIAMAIKLTVPPVLAFACCNVPAIWSALVSWLKPPYIYFIVNGIIITIMASSRLSQLQRDVDYHENSEYKTSPPAAAATAHRVVVPTIPVQSMATVEINVVEAPPPTDQLPYNNYTDKGADDDDEREANIVELKPVVVNGVIEATTSSEAYDRVVKEQDDLVVVSNSTWNHPETDDDDDGYHHHLTVSNSPQTVITSPHHHEAQLDCFPSLPPRFGQPKPIKVFPAGGRAVKKAKPMKNETLESTWKKIMESRERELKKSETFENRGCHYHVNTAARDNDDDLLPRRVLKSATFRDRTIKDDDIIADNGDEDGGGHDAHSGRGVAPFGWSSNMGKIKRELSLSQDELNQRVEAFIKKFNEDMRLQRQQSIDQYMEMINRGVN